MDNPNNIPVKVGKVGTISRFDKDPNDTANIDLKNISISQLTELIQSLNPEQKEKIIYQLFSDINDHIGDYHNPHRVTLDQLIQSPIDQLVKQLLVGSVSNNVIPNYVLRAEVSDINRFISPYSDKYVVKCNRSSNLYVFDTTNSYISITADNSNKCVDYEYIPVIYNSGKATIYPTNYTITSSDATIVLKDDINTVIPNLKSQKLTIHTQVTKDIKPNVISFIIKFTKFKDSFYIYINNNNVSYISRFVDNKNAISSIKTFDDNGVCYITQLDNLIYKVVFSTNSSIGDFDFTLFDIKDPIAVMTMSTKSTIDSLSSNSNYFDQTIYISNYQGTSREIPRIVSDTTYSSTDVVTMDITNSTNINETKEFKAIVLRTTNIPRLSTQLKVIQTIDLGQLKIELYSLWKGGTLPTIDTYINVYVNNILIGQKISNTSNFNTSIFIGLTPDNKILVRQNDDRYTTTLVLTDKVESFTFPKLITMDDECRIHSIETYNRYITRDEEIDFLNNYFTNTKKKEQ